MFDRSEQSFRPKQLSNEERYSLLETMHLRSSVNPNQFVGPTNLSFTTQQKNAFREVEQSRSQNIRQAESIMEEVKRIMEDEAGVFGPTYSELNLRLKIAGDQPSKALQEFKQQKEALQS